MPVRAFAWYIPLISKLFWGDMGLTDYDHYTIID